MRRLQIMKNPWKAVAVALMTAFLAVSCATTGGGSIPKGTRGWLGPDAVLSGIKVADPDSVMTPGMEYRFPRVSESDWQQDARVRDGVLHLELGTPPSGVLGQMGGRCPPGVPSGDKVLSNRL